MVSLIRAIKFKVWLLQTSIHSLSLPTQRRHTIYRHLGRQNAPIHNYKLFYILKYVLTCDDVFIFIKWQKKKKTKYVAQLVKNPPAMQKTWFDSWVGMIRWRREQQPIPVFWRILEVWRIPWTEEPGGLQSLGSQRVRYNWATKHAHTLSLLHLGWNQFLSKSAYKKN